MLRTGARERLSGGVWSQAGIRVVPDCGLQEIAAVMLLCPPRPPSLAQLVSWPGSGWGRLEEPGIAQSGQGTAWVEGAMFISLQVLGVLGSPPQPFFH